MCVCVCVWGVGVCVGVWLGGWVNSWMGGQRRYFISDIFETAPECLEDLLLFMLSR